MRTQPVVRTALISLMLAVAAAGCTSGGVSTTTTLPPVVPDGTTSTAPPTTPAAPATTAVPAPPSDGSLVFAPIDTGVLTSRRPILDEVEAQAGLGFAEEDPDGAVFELTECRRTWPGRWEYDLMWTPPEGLRPPASLRIATFVSRGDVGAATGFFEVTLEAAGAFTVEVDEGPFRAAFPYLGGDEPGLVRGSRDLAALITDGRSCDVQLAAEFPLASDGAGSAAAMAAPRPPQAVHDAMTLQGVVERMDPLGDPLVAVAGLLNGFPEGLPVDGLHLLRDGTPLDVIDVTRRGTCLAVLSFYDDGSRIIQSRGCLPDSPDDPLLSLEPDGIVVDLSTPEWNVAVAGPAIDRLDAVVQVPVAGADPLDPAGRDPDP